MNNHEDINYQIRALQKADNLYDLVELSKKFFKEYEDKDDFFKLDKLYDDDIIDYFANFIDYKDKKAFIAIANNRIVGYVTAYVKSQPSFWRIKMVGDVSGLMVDNDYRRKGIGNQLMTHCKAFFKENNVTHYTVYTSVNNKDAIEFYKQLGMEPLHTTLKGKIE
jgi:ribosomal protein S18 acetylase RimI-like enzyme